MATEQTAIAPWRLRCEYRTSPRGIDERQPRLSWELRNANTQPEIRGLRQTAYQVLVSASEQVASMDSGDLWDSGKVQADATFNVVYSGQPLPSWQSCFWKVRVWDQDGHVSDWSKTALWTMGLLKEEDWKDAQWIGMDEPERPIPKDAELPESRRLPARQLRREFDSSVVVRRATVAFCGLGLSELYLNGRKLSDEVLSPPLTDYDKRVTYVAYDVTNRLKPGRNAIGVWLGNGRYWAPRLKEPTLTRTFGLPKVRLILRIEHSDGTLREICTDETWRATDQGPILANNEYDGEEYDARRELVGWAEPGFNDAAWKPARVLPAPSGVLSARRSPPIRVVETRKPVARTSPQPGVYVFDLGQNLAGWCRLHVKGPAGTVVRLRHSELLRRDGMLETTNLGAARCTDSYTLRGQGDEVYEPRFTYHGFRYVELTGYPGEPDVDAVEACVVHDDLEPAGDFVCSNDWLNRIHAACRWSIRGNYRSIPTDCPQRDERQGWLGDRLGCRGEMQLFDAAAFYEKWFDDIADSQRPDGSVSDVCPAYWPLYHDNVTWAGVIALIPNDVLEQYGDQRLILRHYSAMRAWVEHMSRFIVDDRIPRDTYGDWCFVPDGREITHSKNPALTTSGELIATAYFYHILQLMSRNATLAGNPDAPRYATMAERMKLSFNKRFFDAKAACYDNGTQTSSLLPLWFGVTPREQGTRVFERLVEKIEGPAKSHVGTGLVGVQHLMRVLSDNGRPDLALRIATQPDYPGWGHMINRGATTAWELWNGDTARLEENSRNHVMLIGDLLPWLYEYLAGIRPDPSAPGYRHIVLKPVPLAGVDYVRAWRQTMVGRIESRWRRHDGQFEWEVSIPSGSTATIYIPADGSAQVTESGKPVAESVGMKFLRQENGRIAYEAVSGEYSFHVRQF
jgi:alpha-L-rhamnosidase